MKHYKVAEARARFGDLLDEAERGDGVVIERHGVRYTLTVERPSGRSAASNALFAFVDRDVMSGQWTWTWSGKGARFRPRRQR